MIVAATPFVWASGVAARLPEALAPWLDEATGSRFPVFPFSAFVLAGTLAGAMLGHAPAPRRHRLEIAGGRRSCCSWASCWRSLLRGRVDFWGPSPAYVFVRLGALLLLLRVVEAAAARPLPGVRALALLGHETLLVYVLHLTLLFGGVFGPSPLTAWHGTLGFAGATGVVRADDPGAARGRVALAHGQAPRPPRGPARARVRDARVPLRARRPALVRRSLERHQPDVAVGRRLRVRDPAVVARDAEAVADEVAGNLESFFVLPVAASTRMIPLAVPDQQAPAVARARPGSSQLAGRPSRIRA